MMMQLKLFRRTWIPHCIGAFGPDSLGQSRHLDPMADHLYGAKLSCTKISCLPTGSRPGIDVGIIHSPEPWSSLRP